ncbi:MAG: cytochrome c [Bacteroidales bacterium]|nr:cytochrome c [Bacteroidales bacterium]MCF8386783.1 cytochrome c [Bacteroidales bacterium]MCF8398230.1 cytochrome c [Bacteroidales bacterium]
MNTVLIQLLQIPVPKDIPLEMPLPHWLLVALLIFSFLLHILFVNLMIGGTALTLWAELLGLRKKEYNDVAIEIEKTVTLNKSLAVVLGVAPLLSINVLYTVYFYSANAITGLFWISIIPMVIVAFLLGYWHKYTWEKLRNNKSLHIAIIAGATLIYLFVPFIFLTNINLMQFPEKWASVDGFFSAMTLANVFPRYLHFITASFAVTGLFVFWYFGRRSYEFEKNIPGFSRYEIRRKAMSLAFGASIAQVVFGPLLFITLPTEGIDWDLVITIGIGVTAAVFAMVWMWNSINAEEHRMEKYFWPIVLALTITVGFMGTGRQLYRANALQPHQEVMAQKTAEYLQLVEEAKLAAESGEMEKAENIAMAGEKLFEQNCVVCHQEENRLVGPPLKEIVPIYEGKKEALIAWIKKPGKKRDDYPPMPGFTQLSEEKLESIADYMLKL